MKPQTENSSQVGQMSWNTQTWAASKINVWVALRFMVKRMQNFSACPSFDRKPCSIWQSWLGFLKCEMQDKTSNSEPSTTKWKGSPETKRTGDPQIFLAALLQLLAWSRGWSVLSLAWECCGRRGTGRSSGGFVPAQGSAPELLLSWGGSREGQALLQRTGHCTGQCQCRSCSRNCSEYISDVWLGLEGKGNFLPVLPFTLELGLKQLVRRNEEPFFLFYPERLFRKKEWLLKYLGKFCW